MVMTFLTIALYFPIYVKELGTPLGLEGVNYVGDTLLFGGIVFFVGIAASQTDRRASRVEGTDGPALAA
jgi:hypothetical protein